MPGLAGERETEIVTTVGLDGAINTASDLDSMEVMPPLVTFHVTVVVGGMDPSRVNGSSSLASTLQSPGRMVSVFVGIATALDGTEMESNNKRANKRAILRDINIPGFHEWIFDLDT